MIEPIAKPTPRPPKPRKRLQSKPHPILPAVRDETFARDDYLCQWCRVPGGALDPHHRFRRSQGGRDVAFLLVTVHRLCHDYIHRNVAEAKERKFFVSSEAECAEPWL